MCFTSMLCQSSLQSFAPSKVVQCKLLSVTPSQSSFYPFPFLILAGFRIGTRRHTATQRLLLLTKINLEFRGPLFGRTAKLTLVCFVSDHIIVVVIIVIIIGVIEVVVVVVVVVVRVVRVKGGIRVRVAMASSIIMEMMGKKFIEKGWCLSLIVLTDGLFSS
jgi:hypothetical protein